MNHDPVSRSLLYRLIAVFLIVILAAGAVVVSSVLSTRNVTTTAQTLVSHHLPELSALGELQDAMSRRVIELYLYYATLESASDAGQAREFSAHLSTLERLGVAKPKISALQASAVRFESHAGEFDREMQRGAARDWDVLRGHLAAARRYADEIDSHLRTLGDSIQSRAQAGGKSTLQEVARLDQLQLIFSAGVLLVSGLVLRAFYVRLQDQNELYRRAYTDELTRLPNRRCMERDWLQWVDDTPEQRPQALLMLNLDRYQMLTGTFGHIVGDQLLCAISDWIRDGLHKCKHDGVLYSFTPATWIIRLEQHPREAAALVLANQLLDMAATPIKLESREINATFSIGLSYWPDDGKDLEALLSNADAALRAAKLAGGNGLCLYRKEMKSDAEKRLSIESDLRRALKNGEFELFYQPKIRTDGYADAGAEALIRWRKGGDLISPGVFIPVAEQAALIIPIGEWVLDEACRQWRQWSRDGLPEMPIAVNISAQQFQTADFPQRVKSALQKQNMPPGMLELEITEEAASGNPDQVVATMQALKEIGTTLAIDDFGTGYSSLSYLKRFPLDVIKLDKAFVDNMESSDQDLAIVQMVGSLARELQCKTVAEGVETEAQKRLLSELEFDLMQGYLFSRPLPAEAYASYLARQERRDVG